MPGTYKNSFLIPTETNLPEFLFLKNPGNFSFKTKTAFSVGEGGLCKFTGDYFVSNFPSSTWMESFCCSKFLNVIREPSGFTT